MQKGEILTETAQLEKNLVAKSEREFFPKLQLNLFSLTAAEEVLGELLIQSFYRLFNQTRLEMLKSATIARLLWTFATFVTMKHACVLKVRTKLYTTTWSQV